MNNPEKPADSKAVYELKNELENTLLKLKAISGFCRASTRTMSENENLGMSGEELWGVFSTINDLATTAQNLFYAVIDAESKQQK